MPRGGAEDRRVISRNLKKQKGLPEAPHPCAFLQHLIFEELPRWLRGVKDAPTVPGNNRGTKHRVGRFGPRSTRGFGGVRLPTLRAARNEEGAARADSLPLHRRVCAGFTG